MTTTVSLHVPEIDCVGCVTAISSSLRRLPGVESVEGDAQTRVVTVTFDAATVDVQTIEDTLDAVGFTAELQTTGDGAA